jgi:hypothetical protein
MLVSRPSCEDVTGGPGISVAVVPGTGLRSFVGLVGRVLRPSAWRDPVVGREQVDGLQRPRHCTARRAPGWRFDGTWRHCQTIEQRSEPGWPIP